MGRLGKLLGILAGVSVSAWAESWPDPQWQREPAAIDWQAVEAYAFPDRDETGRTGVRSDALLVIRDGRILYERYVAPTRADTTHLTRSISKSVLATVLGWLTAKGALPSMRRHGTTIRRSRCIRNCASSTCCIGPAAWPGRRTTNTHRSSPRWWPCCIPVAVRTWLPSPQRSRPRWHRASAFATPVATATCWRRPCAACCPRQP